jgi:wobble nucleotide-excising tRNase
MSAVTPNPPQVVIECTGGPLPAIFQNGAWNRTMPDIVVFDDSFVDENVCSGLTVESEHRQRLHELILGAQGVSLNRAVQQAVSQIEDHNRNLRTMGDAIPANVRGSFSIDDFCALQARDDIDEAIREAERNLSAAQEQEEIRTTGEFQPISLPPINLTGVTALLGRDLPELDRAAADYVQIQIGTLGEGGEAWLASGMNRISGGAALTDDRPCPFCAQDLVGSTLIGHYRAYFGTAYADLKNEIANSIRVSEVDHAGEAPVAFERAVRIASERQQFWSRFADVPLIDLDTAAIGQIWASARDIVMDALRAKQNAPLEQITLSQANKTTLAEYERIRQSVAALSNRLQGANAAIRLVKEQAAAGNAAVLEADVARLKAIRSRHTATINPLCADYLSEKATKSAAEQARDSARVALDLYRQTVFPAYQNAVNEYLRKFNAGFRLDRISSQNVGALSAGDRNTLALAFFFASLDQDAGLSDKIVVIDDPISSLDEHRSLASVQEIRRLMQRTTQVVVLSHNKPFLCNIWEGTDNTLRGAIEFVRDGDGSTIRVWDVNRDMITEHDRRHALLREYLNGATPNEREVAQSLRPIIEAFLRVAYPENYPAGTLLGQFRGICEQRVRAAQEILSQADINELRDLTEYANRFHHDTNPTWQTQHINDAELLSFVRRTLAFTKR